MSLHPQTNSLSPVEPLRSQNRSLAGSEMENTGATLNSRRAALPLALNGSLLMLVGFFAGAAIPLVPYPRLMLSAHNAGFTVSGATTSRRPVGECRRREVGCV